MQDNKAFKKIIAGDPNITKEDMQRDISEQSKGLLVTVSITQTDTFKKLLGILKQIVLDERVPKDVRQEYLDQITTLD